jgi:glutamyl-tRNA synthetase
LKLEKFYTYAEELVKQGKAYYCFCSEEELEEARKEAEVEHRTPKYNRRCLHLTKEQIDEKIAKGIPHAIRLKIDENRIYK